MNLALAILVFTTVANLLLGLVVLIRNPRSAQSQSFFLLCISLCIWVLSGYYTDHSNTQFVNLFLGRLDYFAGVMIVASIMLVCENFGNQARLSKRSLIDFFIVLLVFGTFSITPYVVLTTTHITNSTTIIPGTLYSLYPLLALLVLVYGLYKLRKNRGLVSSKPEKTQYTYVFYALLISFPIGLFFAVILPAITDADWAVKISPIATLIMVAPISFAIIRHRLFDIRLIVARALTYVLSIGLLATVYGFTAFRLFEYLLPNTSVSFQQTVDVILAIVLAFTFAPLIRYFSKISNRIFYRDRYDAQLLVNKIGKILASEIDLDKVSHEVVSEVTVQMKIDKGEIVVFGEKQLFYENTVFQRNNANISQKELRKLGRGMLVRDELQSAERKEIMQNYGISVSVALRTSERFIGYLLLGDKKGGDIYNDEDLSVIKIIGSELSVAIQNALSYKEIQLFNETLAQRVRERTAQLRTANDQLRQLDQAKDEFISMASHQLRTPLTTVKGYASMLEEGDFGKLTREQHEKVDLTLDGANRMARLIDDLLNVSRMDANRFFLEVSEVDIVSLVAQELQQLQTLAESKKVKISYTPPAKKSINIRLDENKTRQVVMNLIDNAIHYSQPPAGGGEVQVSLELQKDHIVFLVRDNGIGVPAVVQKRLFTKMFRANNAKAARPDGTGLGLYLVKRVVEDEGGEIIFESTEGKGSTFGFRMPLSGVPKSVEEQSMKIGARVAAHSKS